MPAIFQPQIEKNKQGTLSQGNSNYAGPTLACVTYVFNMRLTQQPRPLLEELSKNLYTKLRKDGLLFGYDKLQNKNREAADLQLDWSEFKMYDNPMDK